jgi:hypothetical protein
MTTRADIRHEMDARGDTDKHTSTRIACLLVNCADWEKYRQEKKNRVLHITST